MIGKLLPFRRGGDREQTSDEALVAACADGDATALEELFLRHGDRVYRTLSRLRGIEGKDLEDLLQTTFLEVQRSAHRFDRLASVLTWIMSIAINVRRHYIRGETRRRSFIVGMLLVARRTDQRAPDEQAIQKQLGERLAIGVDELPEHLRIVFTLSDIEGLRGAEVARILGVPEGTVWRRLHQARMRLRLSIMGSDS